MKRQMKWMMALGAVVMVSATSAHAQGGAKPIAGYRCMMLNITEQQSMDPNFRVTIRSAPSPSAPSAGWAAAVVIVRDPAVPQNGFLQMLKPNGQTAWIPADMVKVYRPAADPNARCVPEVLPNGRIGTGPG